MSFERPEEHVPLAPLTTLGVGGSARWFVDARSVHDVADASTWRDLPVFVLGGGSNLVVSDDGFDGIVVHVGIHGIETTASGTATQLSVGAGESWDRVVGHAVMRHLAGIECLSGIPGTVGGTPVQNVGAYGQEVSSVIDTVEVFDRRTRDVRRFAAAECGFGYRTSRFKREDAGRFVICTVTFTLHAGAPSTVTYPDRVEYFSRQKLASPDLCQVRDAVLAVRRRKGMVIDAADPDTRSVGSFFMNPVVDRATYDRLRSAPGYSIDNDTVKVPAAWLIEHSGFTRGHVDGAVGLSTKHPLAIVNRGGATARDVVRLALRIKRTVHERFGIALRPEPIFVGFDDDPDVESLRA